MKKPLRIGRGQIGALFIDFQEEHRQDARYLVEHYGAVLANAGRLQAAARRNAAPVYHCAYVVDMAEFSAALHPVQPDGRSAFSDKNDPLTAVCHEVAPGPNERLLVKNQASAFGAGPALGAQLKAAGMPWLAVCGVWTEACVAASVQDAIRLGLRVLLVKDACGSGSGAMHQTGILNLANRLYGGAVVDTGAACRLLDGQTVDAWQVQGAVPLRYTWADAAELYRAL
ncbi:isochorismatase family protein [Verminephrobacter eiseniae]|uniref:isochorismatase family protein n=1 Tax=Verminephrobacter eiseniae TaxID=364317 RepID=UPI002237D1EE|nr:isochorismatase family protein [Verminephrobacter eiseniae]MCW5238384.1 isochorismatase family protein [Verminephrobacter eiseniae]